MWQSELRFQPAAVTTGSAALNPEYTIIPHTQTTRLMRKANITQDAGEHGFLAAAHTWLPLSETRRTEQDQPTARYGMQQSVFLLSLLQFTESAGTSRHQRQSASTAGGKFHLFLFAALLFRRRVHAALGWWWWWGNLYVVKHGTDILQTPLPS